MSERILSEGPISQVLKMESIKLVEYPVKLTNFQKSKKEYRNKLWNNYKKEQ
jgi:hypothetical protein